MNWQKIQKKNCCFEVLLSLVLCNNNEPLLDWIVMCNKKWILYNSWWPAQWLDREAPKHLTKSNLHQKRVIDIGGLPLVCSTTAFWILMKPLYLRSMLSKSMRCTKNCSACRQHWWDLFFSTIMPDWCCTTNASKVELIGLWIFASSAIFSWPLAIQLPLLQAFRQLFL